VARLAALAAWGRREPEGDRIETSSVADLLNLSTHTSAADEAGPAAGADRASTF
jgi:hypothetical protein